MNTSKELLRLCGYKQNSSSLHRVEQIKKNYSEFDKVVVALLDLESYLEHSDFYLSLKDYFDLIIIDECHRGGANGEMKWRQSGEQDANTLIGIIKQYL